MLFEPYDSRGYRTVGVRAGYGEWVGTYENTVEDAMDIAVLDELAAVDWAGAARAVDLGCGTGRTGAWLRSRGVPAVDGVDLTPQMLAVARERGAHERLVEADVTETGLATGAYGLAIASLIDEHLEDLRPLYREAWRLCEDDATFVLAAFHPHFIMVSGMPTHFTNADGESVAISTTVHLVSDHVAAAVAAGWRLAEMREAIVDDHWVALKPRWERFRGHPISAAYVWRKESPAPE
jgi:SAM-dependent methyltransferase